MKTKNFALMVASVLSLLLLVGVASAGLGDVTFSPTSLSGSVDLLESNEAIITFDLTNTMASDLDEFTYVISDLTNGVDLISSSQISYTVLEFLDAGDTNTTSITISVPLDVSEGIYTGNIEVYATATANDLRGSADISLEVIKDPFCEYGALNDSELELKVDVENTGEGKDLEWKILDTITVEVELKNDFDLDGDMDLDDVTFELGLFKEGSDKNIAEDMIWISEDDEEFEYGDIDEDEDGTHVFEFRVNPDEVEEGDYILMVKVYSDDYDEDEGACIDYSDDLDKTFYQTISIEGESDKDKMVIVDTESLPKPLEASCNQQVVFTADVWNIGDMDFEDQIMVNLYNSNLGVDVEEVVLGDLDAGDKTEVTFSFEIPSDAEEGSYTFYMRTYYDYDEDDDEYDKESEDLFEVTVNVEGNCVVAKADISASVEQAGKAGDSMVIKATIVNSGDKTATYSVNAAGYATWASSATVDTPTFTLAAGESQEVLFTFDVEKDAEGTETFSIELVSEGQFVETQPVQVSIEGRKLSSLKDLWSKENSRLWMIGILNIILVVVIIIVAVRVARR